jgi:DHA2 family multidrug resistance protein
MPTASSRACWPVRAEGAGMNAAAAPRPGLLATIFVFNFFEFLQSGMVLFATAATLGRIGAAPEEYTLVTALYAAVAMLAVSQMTVLIQRFGWRDFMAATSLLCAAGAWLCAASESALAFCAGRLLMALGGAVFMSASRMMVNLIPPSPARLIGIAAFVAGLTAGLAGSGWLAGWMIGHEAWSGIFLALALTALAGGACALRWLPADAATLTATPSRFDLGDGLALSGGAFLVLYGLLRLAYDWHGQRVQALVLLAGGAALAVLFLRAHGRRADPFLRLEMLHSARYLTGLAIFTGCYVLLGLFFTLLPQLVQRVLGIAIEQAGQLQGAGLALAMPAGAVMLLVVRRNPGASKFYVTGFLALALFGWHFSRFDPAAAPWTSIAPWLGLFGSFVILCMATTALHSFKDLQQNNVLFANAQQFKNMLGQVGLALGAGGGTVLLQQRGALHGARLAENAADVASAGAALLAQQGTLLAGIDVFLLLAWLGVLGAVVLGMMRRFD